MRQFNLNEYIINPNIEIITRDGRKARVICTNKKGEYPVAALVEAGGDSEDVISVTKDGRYTNCVNSRDLFFAPEKHEGWINICKCMNGENCIGNYRIFKSKEDAENVGMNRDDYVATVKIEWEE